MLITKMAGIVVALVVIALATTLTATGVFAGDNPKERPFSAPMEGTFAVLLETCVPVGIDLQCTFELHGEGNATHLGKFADDSTWLVQIDGAIVDPASTRGSIVSGSGTLTAANGEEFDHLGWAVATAETNSGTFVLGGAPGVNGIGINSGAAYIFRRERYGQGGFEWIEEAT